MIGKVKQRLGFWGMRRLMEGKILIIKKNVVLPVFYDLILFLFHQEGLF